MLPDHLSGEDAQGAHRDQPVCQFEIGEMRNFVYLILDWAERKAAIVDPQRDLSAPLEVLSKNGFSLEAVLLTHTLHDHIAGVPELAKQFPSVPFYAHPLDAHRLDQEISTLSDGQKLNVGSLEVEVLHTPGHSAGEVCYRLKASPPCLFTGDTIFIRDCGRTDLATGSNEEMFASLQRIRQLDPKTVILPGHHYKRECASTLERELRESPPFQCKNVKELASLP
jgi:glyoxylase-like metal-dependent hydrolase (beta-lactamase superfamily II)